MSEGEFWHSTLRDIMALYGAYEQAEERLDRRTALLCCMWGGGKVEDYMPGGGSQAEPSPGDLETKLNAFFGAFGIRPQEATPDGCGS